jgi:hypothetical protein
MDTQMTANFNKLPRVYNHRDAKQRAENVHCFPNPQAAGKSHTVLTYNYRTAGGKNATCLLLSSTSFHFAYGYACPGLYFFRTQRILTCLLVWLSLPGFLRPLKSGLTFLRSYLRGICFDHTMIGLLMPAHVVTEASKGRPRTVPTTAGISQCSCDSLSATWINPTLGHCAGGHPESPWLSSQLSCFCQGGGVVWRTEL